MDTQDLAVSNHGRTGRYHVLRTQRGIEARRPFDRCRFRSVQPPASRVWRSAEYALTSRTLHLWHRWPDAAFSPNGIAMP